MLLATHITVLQLHAVCPQVGDNQAEETMGMLEQQLPAMLQYIADILHGHSNKVVLAGCNGLEGEAAIVAVAYGSQHTGQDMYRALVQVQHCYHVLQVCKAKPDACCQASAHM